MIESGQKKEEYREITPYWVKRLVYPCSGSKNCFDKCSNCSALHYRHYDTVEFSLGYPKRDDKSRRMKFKVEYIIIDYGNVELGAPKDKEVFIIMLGERL